MWLGKEVRVVLRDQALHAFLELKKRNDADSIRLVRSIERIIEILKDNPQFGDPITKQLIPQKFTSS